MKKRWIILLVFSFLVFGSLVVLKVTNTQVVFTGLLSPDTLFRVDGSKCSLTEGKIYLANTIARYQEIYGEKLFEQDFGGVTAETFLKENVIARLSKIKAMGNLAEKWEISLSKEEKAQAGKAAQAFLETLGKEKADKLGANEGLLKEMYEEYALAEKAFAFFTEGEEIEVSEDEARVIVVWHIFFQAYKKDEKGAILPYSEEEKSQVYGEAQQVYGMLAEGADFANLAASYSDDTEWEYTIGRGEMPEAFDKAAFELEKDELSQIVETPYGYHIIKCVSDFEERETQLHKKQLIKEKQNQRFAEIYEEYAAKLHVRVNEDKWDKVKLEDMKGLGDGSFFSFCEGILEQD